MSDPRTAAEMRALAAVKHDEAVALHARAAEAGERLAALVSKAISLGTGTLKPGPCPTCGHVQAHLGAFSDGGHGCDESAAYAEKQRREMNDGIKS